MPKKTSVPRTGNKTIDAAFNQLSSELNKLSDMVINPRGRDSEGDTGAVRFVERKDGHGYLEGRGRNGWFTTFLGVFQKKVPNSTPYPFFEKLMVDELYATQFIVNQLESTKEVLISQGGAEVESVTANTITFKDTNKTKSCPFSANDLILAKVISLDKGLEIRKVEATVTSVSTNVCTVSYASGFAQAGDNFVQIGNTTNGARQSSILLSVNDTNAPFIDLYDNISSFAAWDAALGVAPVTRVGNLSGITHPTLGALSGYGLYGSNVYLTGNMTISNPEDIDTSGLTNDAGWTTTKTYRQAAAPSSGMAENDIWYDTDGYQVYRYNGSSWEEYGVKGTRIDGDGIYTGTLTAIQVNAVAINADSITTGTLTGVTVSSSVDDTKIVLNSGNSVDFYSRGGLVYQMYSSVTGGGDYPSGTKQFTIYDPQFSGKEILSHTSISPDYVAQWVLRDTLEITDSLVVANEVFAGEVWSSSYVVGSTEVITSARALTNITDYGLSASDMPSSVALLSTANTGYLEASSYINALAGFRESGTEIVSTSRKLYNIPDAWIGDSCTASNAIRPLNVCDTAGFLRILKVAAVTSNPGFEFLHRITSDGANTLFWSMTSDADAAKKDFVFKARHNSEQVVMTLYDDGDAKVEGDFQAGGYKSGDGSTGLTQTKSFSTSTEDHSVVIKDGLITSWTIV